MFITTCINIAYTEAFDTLEDIFKSFSIETVLKTITDSIDIMFFDVILSFKDNVDKMLDGTYTGFQSVLAFASNILFILAGVMAPESAVLPFIELLYFYFMDSVFNFDNGNYLGW